MLFSSWNFMVYFLPVTVLVFYLIPASFQVVRKVWLIGASLFFYGYWKVEYVPLLLLSIVVNYALAEAIIRATTKARTILTAGVTANLLLLGYFKYTNFAVTFLGHLVQRDFGHFNIILPLAISFFTFTQISYLVDVYRDRTAHYRFLDYFLFVVLFPHLIAGPIVRHWEIIPQFVNRELKANRENFGVGMTLFLFGLIKKFMADSVATTPTRFTTAPSPTPRFPRSMPGSAPSLSPSKSTLISPPTPTWLSASPACSASSFRPISIRPTAPLRSSFSGNGGTARSPVSYASMSTLLSAEIGAAMPGRCSTSWPPCCSAVSGTARGGPMSSGAACTARSLSSTTSGASS